MDRHYLVARQARLDILEMSFRAKAGHIPSAMSMVDYLTVLFDRLDLLQDRLILGKPYGAQAYYALFAANGWIEPTWHLYGTPLPEWTYIIDRGHPLVRFIDDTMGNALAVGCGIAQGCNALVYVNCSDASLQAGTMWEAIQFAGFRRLDNLLLSIDNNDMQVSGRVSEICAIEPLVEKFTAFGWHCISCDGHDFPAIAQSVDLTLASRGRPKVLVFNTVKGRGVPFLENDTGWHYRALDDKTYAAAVRSLE